MRIECFSRIWYSGMNSSISVAEPTSAACDEAAELPALAHELRAEYSAHETEITARTMVITPVVMTIFSVNKDQGRRERTKCLKRAHG